MTSNRNKHTMTVGGRKTSVSLEDYFWQGLRQIAVDEQTSVSNLVARI